MAESGIDLGYDLSALLSDDFDIESAIDFDDLLGTPKNQEFYELTSKTMPVNESPPNLKTATPLSRTQLKLQLMRDQALMEQERQAQERARQAQAMQQRPPASAMKVPLHSLAVEVPPQVLQVQTKLANPTRYHVIQKQKSQVRQYLSESFQAPGNAHFLNNLQNPVPQTHSAPGIAGAPVPSAPLMPQQSLAHSHPFQVSCPSPEAVAMSPALSSGATSTSEAEDLIDDLLSLESSSLASDSFKTSDNSLPGNDINIKNEPFVLSDAELHALAKDRQKKDNHNMIERRRRFNINDRIKELGTLLPKNNDPYYEIVRDVRPNKGTILKSSVEYIKCLKNEVQRLKQSEIRQKQIEHINRRLQLRVQELERQMKSHGLPLSEFNFQGYNSPYNSYQKSQNQPPPTALLPPIMLSDPNKKGADVAFQMPDVINDAALSMSTMEELMDDDEPVNGDPMLSSPNDLSGEQLLTSPALCEPRLPTPTPTSHIEHVDGDTLDIDMIA
ncbi:microphthalmia-associated transcription factor isoform X1 [Tribolium castaneum]|uniref:Transcription factor E3-like Protein n=1 Tax=Tribolium castaneum TaxID=7070 RepID=D6W756_TRICA|nr:PREDICTED: microphthalmia-associated transcription factor isoform X1 [Tribolium castaneum]EFA11511.1 Transcription factor E3-like Protein [Tribolium castaneum]|eukprot:XP_975837.2 PREDICTED: microphthalmia-associated transcription factor isoform X1 [Tribolium castaneum]